MVRDVIKNGRAIEEVIINGPYNIDFISGGNGFLAVYLAGIVANTNKRFATKIAIGDNYFDSTKKVLFVSLDIGSDEYYNENRFQVFLLKKVHLILELKTLTLKLITLIF